MIRARWRGIKASLSPRAWRRVAGTVAVFAGLQAIGFSSFVLVAPNHYSLWVVTWTVALVVWRTGRIDQRRTLPVGGQAR